MKRLCALGLIALFVVSSAFCHPSLLVPKTEKSQVADFNAEHVIPADAPRFSPRLGELDQIFGDTLMVGTTYWDNQHNGTVGRMIGFTPNNVHMEAHGDVSDVSFLLWTRLSETPGTTGPRHVHITRAWYNEENQGMIETVGGNVVDAGFRAGYCTLAMDAERGLAIPTFHNMVNQAADPKPQVAWEWSLFPNIYNTYDIPDYGANVNIWPRSQFAEYNGTRYVHMATSENRDDDNAAEMDILYCRVAYDEANDSWVPGDQVLITEHGMNITADLAVSNDGARVAIAQTVSRDYVIHNDPEPTQHNNDMYIFLSEDGGESWNDPINLTDFILPDPEPNPDDTLGSEGDTIRCYADASVYFDHDNVLHVAFSAEGFFYHKGSLTRSSQIYHWDEESDVFTMAADGRFWNRALPEVWGRTADRPCMYQDPDTRILYMTYRQMGEAGDTLADGSAMDGSDDGFGNYDIYLTATPPNNENGDWYGRLWTKGINITNTKGTDGLIAAGDCRSELDPSIAHNNDGEYLHLFYTLDLDAGFACYNETPEGEYTLNPMVFHRVNKADLITYFDEQAQWLPNYPMHKDSTQHWEDPLEYEYSEETGNFWRGENSVGSADGLTPSEFAINSVYPNPFNPSTTISFSVANYSNVSLTVYDLLGRQVAELVNRNMSAGEHKVSFHGANLASGIYFVKLNSGDLSATQKMMLIK